MASGINPIWNQSLTAHATHNALPGKDREMVQDTNQDADPTSSSGTDSATISANDFLTLLVTEMKNQDPTANTDPNEYINQLVQVNSLEQLISINQTLTADSSATPTGSAVKANALQQPSASHAQPFAGGNLTIPESSPAAQRVAGALGIQVHRL